MNLQALQTPHCRLSEAGLSRYFGLHCMLGCQRCGQHSFDEDSLDDAPHMLTGPGRREAVAHAVRKLPNGAVVSLQQFEAMTKTVMLPGAAECMDNLLMHLADAQPPGMPLLLRPANL